MTSPATFGPFDRLYRREPAYDGGPKPAEIRWDVHQALLPAPATLEGLRPPVNPELNLPAVFYDGDPNNRETAQASSHLVPQTRRSDFRPVTRAGWRTVPNSYVISQADVSITATVAERLAARADTVYRCPGHHVAFYSHPKEFAEILVRIAEPSAPDR